IPQDISIISFDDQPYCEYLSPPMTMIAQQKAEMGEIAVKLLINQIGSKENSYDKGNTVHKIVIPTRLVIRKSVSIIS
ncbi:MAG: substrate-binding domain-containing protein, partial [Candidatus Marinimicrobia bacterium]|nr:substrate-binding domain-containing protein [Candidatus Neomarinimicrobiota bacterium]